MATKKQKIAKQVKAGIVSTISPALLAHFKEIGVNGEKDYLNWCKKHKFKPSLNKNSWDFRNELVVIARERADKILSLNKIRNPASIIDEWLNNYGLDYNKKLDGYCTTKIDTSNLTALPSNFRELEKVLENAIKAGTGCFEATKRLIRHVFKVSEEVLFEEIEERFQFISAFPAIAQYANNFIRPLENWRPKSHNARKQFSALVRYLFGQYSIPTFMDQAWIMTFVDCREQIEFSAICRKWFIYLGTGQNFRNAPNLPVGITKKQAHYFCKAPDDYSIIAAIRYGQIMSFGGDVLLANALQHTKLCTLSSFTHDDFWQSVIRWFIDNPMLDKIHVGPIIDWLYNQKFEKVRTFVGAGRIEYLDPPQPNLSMKKRDVMGVLRSVEEWHLQLGRAKKANNLQWVSCGIKPFEFLEGQGEKLRIWKITELLSGKELTTEGRNMHHCVASYAASCESGRASIWSMTCENHEGVQRHVTIEVNNSTKSIVQVRGKYNAKPTVQQESILARWAQQNGLKTCRFI